MAELEPARPAFEHSFTKPNADIVLRSCDRVEFRVHKLILSEASPVFADMVSLPQPLPGPPSQDPSDVNSPTLPVVELSETARTLDHLLRICYPTIDPVLDSVADVVQVVEAAKKYDMCGVLARGVAILEGWCTERNSALRAYVAASQLGLRDVMERAARRTLSIALGSTLPDGLRDVSPDALFQYLDYRRRAHSAAVAVAVNTNHWEFYSVSDILLDHNETYSNDALHTNWGFPENFDGVVLPLEWLREDHHKRAGRWAWDPEWGVPHHINMGSQDVLRSLIKQLKDVPDVTHFRVPKCLLEELLGPMCIFCTKCLIKGLRYFEDFFDKLAGCIHDAVMEIKFWELEPDSEDESDVDSASEMDDGWA